MEMKPDVVVTHFLGAVVEAGAALLPEKAPAGKDESTPTNIEMLPAVSSSGGGLDGEDASAAEGGEGMVSPVLSSPGENSGEEVEAPMEELSGETKAAIVKQVEFYFSDENLPTDNFMKKKMKAGGAQGWVPLKVVCSFPKVKKLSKDARAIAAALEGSAMLVVRPSRVRRKTPFKEGTNDFVARTVLAVNIPSNSTVESLMPFFSGCGVAEVIRVVRKSEAGTTTGSTTPTKADKSKEIQPPVGAQRNLYATCQFSTLEEAIRAVNELTDRQSWRGGLRVTLANGVTVEKALAKLKAASKKAKQQEQREKEAHSPTPTREGQRKRDSKGETPRSPAKTRNVRDGQMRSRSLTELELENTGGGGRGGGGGSRGNPTPRRRDDLSKWGGCSGEDGDSTTPPERKLRSVSNVDALFSGGLGGGGEEGQGPPPRHSIGNSGGESRLPRKGVVQTVSSEGWSWIKKDGNGSRKSGNRVPFALADVVIKDGEVQKPLQKGDHVEYCAWRDSEGQLMAVRVERLKERPRPAAMANGGGGGGAQRRTDRATQAHFRMAIGPEEGKTGFAAGRGRPLAIAADSSDGQGDVDVQRPRGSSMGGPDSKVFVPAAFAQTAAQQFEDAD